MGSPQRIIFNASLPRAGGTLVQLFLGQNPGIFASVHSPLVELVHNLAALYEANYGNRGTDGALARRSFAPAASGLLQGFYSFVPHPVVIDKGGTGALAYRDLIESALGRFEVFACVRDPRAIIASLERDFQGGTLARIEMPPRESCETFADRADWWLKKGPLALGYERLKPYIVRGVATSKVHILRYEDFAAAPRASVGALYDAFGLSHFNHDFSRVPGITDDNSFVPSSRCVSGPIRPTTERETRDLPPEISERIVMRFLDLYKEIYPEAFSMNPDSIVSEYQDGAS